MSEASNLRTDQLPHRREIRTIASTVRKDDPKSFANALDLAAAVGATPAELSWLLIEILPELDGTKSFWKDEALVHEFASKVPASDDLVARVGAGLADRTVAAGRSLVLLASRVADQDELWSSEVSAQPLLSQLEASVDGLVVALRLSRRLNDAVAYPLLVRHIGDTRPYSASGGAEAQTIGELSGEMLQLRGYSAGLSLLQRMDEIATPTGMVNAIHVLEALGIAESVDYLGYLVQDVTFGSTLAEVLLAEEVIGPLLIAAEEAGALKEVRDVIRGRAQWKPVADDPVTASANVAAFLDRLNKSRVASRLGRVLMSPDFFYSLARIFFSRKILSAMRHLMSDADADIRKAAARALGRFEHPSATRALKEAIWDRSKEVRAVALQSLRQHMSAEEIEALVAERTARNEEMKAQAQAAKEDFETIQIDSKFVNAVKKLGFSTYGVVSSSIDAAKSAARTGSGKATEFIRSVVGRKVEDNQEDAS